VPSRSRLPAVTLLSALGCNAGFHQGPDRPEDPDVLGPPPPAAFHCEDGTRRRVERRDAQPTRVVYALGNGDVLCSSEDRNGDGKLDIWVRIEQGQVVLKATDDDFDGRLDTVGAPTGDAGTTRN
jgi:hypothetical protein